MKSIRRIIQIDEELCDGCGQCVPTCEEGALQIIDGKAKLLAEGYCDGLGACLGVCPMDALQVIDVEADAFDEAAVEAHLTAMGASHTATGEHHTDDTPCGCPTVELETLGTRVPEHQCACDEGTAFSALSHWPVKIRLVPPTAPYLKDAQLFVTADCVPIAYPRFHEDFLGGRVVLAGCPKFDDLHLYEQRFADLFAHNDIKSIQVAVMEVPCCQGLPTVVQNAMNKSGKSIPMERITITLQGEVMQREAILV